ncbi:MAG: hypothetical protein QUV07_13645 [Cyanobium sp. CZS 25K]|nr:hypothetical protein [Cyanobium sp. CZS25K]
MTRRRRQYPGTVVPLLLLAGFAAFGAPSPCLGQPTGAGGPSDAEEEANCRRVSEIVTANSAPVQEALERLARQRYGRPFSELSPEQLMALAMAANAEGGVGCDCPGFRLGGEDEESRCPTRAV